MKAYLQLEYFLEVLRASTPRLAWVIDMSKSDPVRESLDCQQ